jgi:hypothetical protein
MSTRKFNNYSKELLEHFPKLAPGQALVFRLNGIRYDPGLRRTIVPNTVEFPCVDRIYDPYTKEYIDISWIEQERPAPPSSNKETEIVIGNASFTRAGQGEIFYRGGDTRNYELARFLFFSNRNKSNVEKPWHIPPSQYIFEVKDNEDHRKTLATERLVDQAKQVIDSLSSDKIKEIKRGMFPNDHINISEEQVILKLREVAVKNPSKIINLSKDVDLKVNAFITRCTEANLIKFVEDTKEWKWADTGEIICRIKPGNTAYSGLKLFFMSETGLPVMEALEVQLSEGAAAPKVQQKPQSTAKPPVRAAVAAPSQDEEMPPPVRSVSLKRSLQPEDE